MLNQFNHETVKKAFTAFTEFVELDHLLESSRSGSEFKNYDPELAKKHLELIRDSQGMKRLLYFLNFLHELNEWSEKVTLSLTKLNPSFKSLLAISNTCLFSSSFTLMKTLPVCGITTLVAI